VLKEVPNDVHTSEDRNVVEDNTHLVEHNKLVKFSIYLIDYFFQNGRRVQTAAEFTQF